MPEAAAGRARRSDVPHEPAVARASVDVVPRVPDGGSGRTTDALTRMAEVKQFQHVTETALTTLLVAAPVLTIGRCVMAAETWSVLACWFLGMSSLLSASVMVSSVVVLRRAK